MATVEPAVRKLTLVAEVDAVLKGLCADDNIVDDVPAVPLIRTAVAALLSVAARVSPEPVESEKAVMAASTTKAPRMFL